MKAGGKVDDAVFGQAEPGQRGSGKPQDGRVFQRAAIREGDRRHGVAQPGLGGRHVVAEREQNRRAVAQESEAAQDQALDLVRFQRGRRLPLGTEQRQPALRLILGHGHGQPLPDRGVGADVGGRQIAIGRIPECRRNLLAPRPALEAVAVGRAVQEQVRRLREADRVRPDAGQAGMGLGDEILEIAFPAAAVVREEQEVAGPWHHDPAREMDAPDGAEESRPIEAPDKLRDQPERKRDREAPQPAGLHDGDRGQQVLRRAVFPVHDRGDRTGRRRTVDRHFEIFAPPEQDVRHQRADPRHHQRHDRNRDRPARSDGRRRPRTSRAATAPGQRRGRAE